MIAMGISGPTYEVNQVPDDFKEEFIIRGYRYPRSSAKQCILSIFDATNETFNFWTHFLPPWYFLWVLVDLSRTTDFINDSYSWPLLCYMVSICLVPLASATAHTFNVMSVKARHVCFFLDYSAISLFSMASAVAYRGYMFPSILQKTWYADNYITFAFFNAITCTVISCHTRLMKQSLFRHILRLSSFAGPYLFVTVPVYIHLALCLWDNCSQQLLSLISWHIFFATISVILYVSHIPERWHPGAFDIIGHSHQIFHIAVTLSIVYQMHFLLMNKDLQKDENLQDWIFHSLWSSIGIISLVFFINALTVIIFSIILHRVLSNLKSSKKNGFPVKNSHAD